MTAATTDGGSGATTLVAAGLRRSRLLLRRHDRAANFVTAAALCVVLPLLTHHAMPRWFQPHTFQNLDIGVAMAVAALSLNLLLGYTGQISLGHAAFLAMGAFVAGIADSRWHLPTPLGVVLAIAAGAGAAFVIGIPALRLRGLYLAIVTIVFYLVMLYTVLPSDAFSGGSAGVDLVIEKQYHVYLVLTLLLLLGVWVLDVNIVRTRVGRAFRTIRENEPVAQSFGIDVTRYKLLAFTVSGGLAGLAGAMYGHALGHVNSEHPFDLNLSLNLVVIVVVAGAGYRFAVILAALLFTLFPQFVTGLHAWAFVFGAVVLMLTIARHPEGLAHMLAHRRPPKAQDDDADADDELPPLPQLPVPVRAVATEAAPDAPVLDVRDVVVRFGGLQAVDHASLTVPAGRITGLIGPNGAGKSTLFNAVSGLVRIQGGRILYRGREIQTLRSDQRARLGIARSFQQVGLARDLSVRENFLLAQHQLAGYGDAEALLMLPRAARQEREFGERADAAIDALGFTAMAGMPVRNLSGGQQRIVEIACLLMTAPDLVMLDEPSAGMAPAAAENLAGRLRDLRDALGRTVLLIEHNVPLVLDTCDYVYVLDAGRVIAAGEPREIAANPAVVEAYFGTAV